MRSSRSPTDCGGIDIWSTVGLLNQRCPSFRSLHLFLELWDSPTDEEHVQAYLWLGCSYKQRGKTRDIRACYEMGLLTALHAKNLHSKCESVEHPQIPSFRKIDRRQRQTVWISVG